MPLPSSDYQENLNHLAIDNIMGKPPSWVIYWGITVISIFMLIILGIATIINYPDTLQTKAIVYIDEIPIKVFCKHPGVIQEILVKENQIIETNTPLVVLKSTADWKSEMVAKIWTQKY